MKTIPEIKYMPVDIFERKEMADMAERTTLPILHFALQAYADRRYEEALDDFTTLIDATFDDDEAESRYLTARGTIHFQMGYWIKALKDFDKALRRHPNHVALFRRGLVGIMTGKETDTTLLRNSLVITPSNYKNLNDMTAATRNNLFEAGAATIVAHLYCASVFLGMEPEDWVARYFHESIVRGYTFAAMLETEFEETRCSRMAYLMSDKNCRDRGYDILSHMPNEKLAQRREWFDGFLEEDPARRMVYETIVNLANRYHVMFESDTGKIGDWTRQLAEGLRGQFTFYDGLRNFIDEKDIVREFFLTTALQNEYRVTGRLTMKHLDELAGQFYVVLGDVGRGGLYDTYDEFRLDMYAYILNYKKH